VIRVWGELKFEEDRGLFTLLPLTELNSTLSHNPQLVLITNATVKLKRKDRSAMSSREDEIPTTTTTPWIRGVNLGGWLVMERYIVPYQFAVTECHVAGDFCWFPGQLSAPRVQPYKLCDLTQCPPVRVTNAFGHTEYPVDEKTLAQAFRTAQRNNNETTTTTDLFSDQAATDIAEQWFNYHFENFIQMEDLLALKQAGVTHLRVPIPHWILGDVQENEFWIVGKRWECFVRVCKWARELGLYVWPDVHTAPGSQNGFGTSLLIVQ
jgi:glucan 1,3-beta-glucosidase